MQLCQFRLGDSVAGHAYENNDAEGKWFSFLDLLKLSSLHHILLIALCHLQLMTSAAHHPMAWGQLK